MSKGKIQAPEGLPSEHWFRSALVPPLILSAVTLIAFANAWPNNLVLDDPNFAGPGRPQEFDSLLYIFTHDVWYAKGIHSVLYRPLLLLCLSVESWLFGDWLAGYHLSNIFYHLLASLLVYGFFRHLLNITSRQNAFSDLYALLAALVFAVHPVHTEVVNSAFNRSDTMVTILGLGGLWWLLHHLKTHPARAWLGLGATYFLAMLFKENAIVIPGVAVCLVLLMATGSWPARIRKCLPAFWLLLPLAAYLALRAHALAQPDVAPITTLVSEALEVPEVPEGPAFPESPDADGREDNTLFQDLVFPTSDRLVDVIRVMGLALKLAVWPHPLLLYQSGSLSLPFGPVGYVLPHVLLMLVAGIQFRRRHYGFAAGLVFFYLAMLPSTRIFGEVGIESHLAERYLYFPSAGLAMMLVFAIKAAAQKFGPRVVINITLPALLLFTVLTWDRNAEWASNRELYETDYARGDHGKNILRLLTSTYIREKDYAKAARICDENWDMQESIRNTSFPYYCSIAYEHQNRIEAAERVYRLQIDFPRTRVLASRAFAKFYVRQNRPKDAVKHFINAINWSNDPATKAYYTAEMMLALNPGNREQLVLARSKIQEALRLRPRWEEAQQMLEELNKILD